MTEPLITIRQATLRDASYVTANLRELDRAEVFCQLAEGTRTHELAYALTMADDTYCAYYRGTPAAVFGVGPINICTLSFWAIGTRHMWCTVPAITRYFLDVILPGKIEQGFTSAEARSLAGHLSAHRWMISMGAEMVGEPFLFGRNGEHFQLFRWTVADYRTIKGGKPAERGEQEFDQ